MGGVSTAIVDILECEQSIVEKKLRRVGLSLESFAKNLNRKCHCFEGCKEDLYKKMTLSEKRHPSLQSAELYSVSTLLRHCFEMKTLRPLIFYE